MWAAAIASACLMSGAHQPPLQRYIFYPWSEEYNLPLISGPEPATARGLIERSGVLWARGTADGSGLMVDRVAPRLDAEDMGLRSGDLIIFAGFADGRGNETLHRVESVGDLSRIVVPSGSALIVRYMRFGKQRGAAIAVWIRIR